METFSAISMIFILGGVLGYILELFYRRIRHGKWINPGFLAGPFLPLYGFGTLFLYILCLWGERTFAVTVLGKLCLLLLIAVVMTLVELITGLIFVYGMRVKLWDYSELWGNFKGIICPLFSLIWGLIGAFYYFVLHRYLLGAVAFLKENPFDTFIVGLFFGVFLVDVCYSFGVVTKLRALAKKSRSIIGLENLKVRLRTLAAAHHRGGKFLLPFRNDGEVEDAVNERKTPAGEDDPTNER